MEKRAHPEPTSNVRFGAFEVEIRRGELRKEGRRIRLQEQPFQFVWKCRITRTGRSTLTPSPHSWQSPIH
jgi:hypothetical protein